MEVWTDIQDKRTDSNCIVIKTALYGYPAGYPSKKVSSPTLSQTIKDFQNPFFMNYNILVNSSFYLFNQSAVIQNYF